MIDEKKITEATVLNADKYNPCRSTLDREEACRASFEDGVEWFKNALWHPVSEVPTRYDTYLVKTNKGAWTFAILQLRNGIVRVLARLINGLIWQI